MKINKSGYILIDKSINVTSNKTLQKFKNITNVNKAGYTGTLDPLATGILPIMLNDCTKYSDILLKKNKQYIVIGNLYKITNTYDKDGILLKKMRKKKIIYLDNIIKNLSFFKGKILQTPSIYSSIKYKGSHLYKYARSNININIKKKKVII